jgi:hypothetical protein
MKPMTGLAKARGSALTRFYFYRILTNINYVAFKNKDL